MKHDPKQVLIFDTTLRDGEQAPGCSLTVQEKVQVARQLDRLGVDIIEAGFPASSPGEIEAIRQISKTVRRPILAGLARMVRHDIDAAVKALSGARRKRLHVFIATSEVHMKYKLRKQPREVLDAIRHQVRYGRRFFKDIEFSCEDAARSKKEFLAESILVAIEAGASTVNIPDTVGYAVPWKFEELITYLRAHVPALGRQVVLSIHCHNDLGLATANSLAAIKAGARQVECTVNGIGERAGNAAMEEIVMALKTRRDFFGLKTNVRTQEIIKTSRLVSHYTGMMVQPNKAVVGQNAFAHEAGIHQDGILKKRTTYEILDPKEVGLGGSNLVLGKHSGRHAFVQHMKRLGYRLGKVELERVFARFKDLADRKKTVYDGDLRTLVENEIATAPRTWVLDYLHISSGTQTVPTAMIRLKKQGKQMFQDAAHGDGPVDACLKAIDRITGFRGRLEDYAIKAVTAGEDAQGEVTVIVRPPRGPMVTGRGSSTDVIEASAQAYLDAINKSVATLGKSVRT